MPISIYNYLYLDLNVGRILFCSEFLDTVFEDKEIQTDAILLDAELVKPLKSHLNPKSCRSLEECLKIYNNYNLGGSALTDDEIILLVKNKQIPGYQIEKAVDDPERGVEIRRKILAIEGKVCDALTDLPYKNYDYSKV